MALESGEETPAGRADPGVFSKKVALEPCEQPRHGGLSTGREEGRGLSAGHFGDEKVQQRRQSWRGR